jgi:hypothetical protein
MSTVWEVSLLALTRSVRIMIDIGVFYVPSVWYSYCSFQFDCNSNNNATSDAIRLFSEALRLNNSIPLYNLANLSTYVVSYTRCSAACLVSMFDMYKHFNSTKDYYFSISNSAISSVDMTSLLFYNDALPFIFVSRACSSSICHTMSYPPSPTQQLSMCQLVLDRHIWPCWT